ncbi:response regulator [Aquibacillus halophilus]|uniref:Response regulator n=1 Tax=Aquibacillus halophilus TaxID=930132 RepID=A0A6A8DLW2_9BACI|nr:response regulator [Aquibacillus halophilus]MRH43987.1 response regulator [Aquibacillus halophilus]
MGKTVMIVDDQLGIRLLLEEIVKGEGYQVVTAENGKEALDKIEKSKPDLLIIDFKLPIMDGFAVLNHLDQLGEKIPAIIMSGLAEEAAAKVKDLPMVKEVFAKPFDVEDARKHINRLLN